MKNKLIFRILGSLSSALIIAAVFIPFVNVSGYTQSLWQAYNATEIYLPIMIITFGSIGVLFFAINIKTEFAYSTSGALLFYTITETISFIKQDTLSSLGVGYYCLVVGTLLTGLMAFLCNLRTKKVVEINESIKVNEEISMLNKIDKLYDDQNTNNLNQSNDSLNNIIQPLPVTNIEPIMEPQVTEIQPLNNLANIQSTIVEQQPITIQQPVENQVIQENQPIMEPQVITEVQPIESQPMPNVDEPVQPVSIPQMNNNVVASNPVVAEFEVPVGNIQDQPQPMLATEPQNEVVAPVEQPNLFEVNENKIESSNPVVSEFTNQTNTIFSNHEVPQVNNVNAPTSNNSDLDIFN